MERTNKKSIMCDKKIQVLVEHNNKELEENYYDTQIIFGRYKHKEV